MGNMSIVGITGVIGVLDNRGITSIESIGSIRVGVRRVILVIRDIQ